MKTPNVQTTNGKKPLTVLPNEALVEGFLAYSTSSEDLELVRLLAYAEPSKKKAGEHLRNCLEGNRSLVPIYHSASSKVPANGVLIGAIPDGALYLV